MIAVLRYTDCLEDGKMVFRIITKKGGYILKTRRLFCGICPRITVLVRDAEHLNSMLEELNSHCTYEVSLVKIKGYNLYTRTDTTIRSTHY